MKTNTTTTKNSKTDQTYLQFYATIMVSIVLTLFIGSIIVNACMIENKTYYIAPDGQVYEHNIDNSRQSIKLCSATYDTSTVYALIINQGRYTEKVYCSDNKLELVTTYINNYKLAKESAQIQNILCDWINN